MRSSRLNPILLPLLVIALGLFIAVTLGPPAGVGVAQEPAVSTHAVTTYTVVTDALADTVADAPREPAGPHLGVAGPGMAALFALILFLGALSLGSRRCRSRDEGPPGAGFGITVTDRCLLN